MTIIKNLYYRYLDKAIAFYLKKSKVANFDGNLIVRGFPIINLHKDANITIGDNVTLNSRNYGYHAAMYSPVKLFADRENAEITIGKNTRIHGSCIHAIDKISIGNNCLIAANTNIIDSNGHEVLFEDLSSRLMVSNDAKEVIIEDHVWVGLNSIILPGVKISRGSVIAAGSVVHKDVPPMCIVGGNPARILKGSHKDNKYS